MIPQEIIRKKKLKQALNQQEIRDFFDAYLKDQVADYQMSALLMAVCLNGMNREEITVLTEVIRDSGTVFKWEYPKEQVVDKHSTGGIGDKTSLILLPLAVLSGVKVPMISGRGLGHTGGTLDKLESIPGMNVKVDAETARKLIDKWGGVFMGQTQDIAPLDRRLYALRDVTATVESIPLITSSILSKKLAEGIGGLVMDVKFGSGAFIPERDQAEDLAQTLKEVGEACGVNVVTSLNSMDSPLGRCAGNALEVFECVEVMKGKGSKSTRELSVHLASEMVKLAFPERSKEDILKKLYQYLDDGSAFECFKNIVNAQGGDLSVLDNESKLLSASIIHEVKVDRAAHISVIDVRKLGIAILTLGGGRRKHTDEIDHSVGLSSLKHLGESVENGDPLCVIHSNNQDLLNEAEMIVRDAYKLS